MPWDWEAFGEFLDSLDGKTAVNAGFLVGHSALRRYVMGPDADQPADPGQLAQMVQALHDGLAAGGMGFSTSLAYIHWNGNNEPVPSRFSSTEEVLALAGAVADHPGTWLEFITSGCLSMFSGEEIDLMNQMSARAQRPLNWNVLTVSADTKDRTNHQLGASDAAAAVGGRIVALSMPTIGGLKLCFDTYCPLYNMPGWKDTTNLPRDEKKAALADPEVRRWLNQQAQSGSGGFYHMAQWQNIEIGTTYAPENVGLTGRRVGDIAAEHCMRLFAGAQGVHWVLVGGSDIVVNGQVTGATPGTVLRSGRDTGTVLP